MLRLTADEPTNNYENLHNFAFIKNGETFLRWAGDKPNVRLADYLKEMCLKRGCSEEVFEGELEDGFMGCYYCPLAVLFYCAVAAADLRALLKMYEDEGIPITKPYYAAWVRGEDGCHCSECGYAVAEEDITPFCGACGRCMEVRDDDGDEL